MGKWHGKSKVEGGHQGGVGGRKEKGGKWYNYILIRIQIQNIL